MIHQTTVVEKLSRYIFPLLTLVFIVLYLMNRPFYSALIAEDSLAEWLTFVFLTASGIVSLIITLQVRKKYGYIHWFFLFFFAFNIFAGLEEISWGQRVFELKTEGVFAKYSDQNEINFHNTMQGLLMVKTKHIAMYALFIYGVIFPWVIQKGKLNIDWIKDKLLIIPPMFLTSGFLIATLFMIDVPSGREEEIGEFLYSICFLLLMLHNLNLVKNTSAFEVSFHASISKRTPSFKE